jgi:hypothetical protein
VISSCLCIYLFAVYLTALSVAQAVLALNARIIASVEWYDDSIAYNGRMTVGIALNGGMIVGTALKGTMTVQRYMV